MKPSATTHFSWRTANLSVYKAFTHQHLLEIGRNLRRIEPAFDAEIDFVPMRGDFARGILASVYTRCTLEEADVRKLYAGYYATAPFTHVTERGVDLKQVVNTNKALLQVARHGDKLHVVSAIDNLLKGASGQAVENMNLLFGLDEREGAAAQSLRILKPKPPRRRKTNGNTWNFSTYIPSTPSNRYAAGAVSSMIRPARSTSTSTADTP